MPSVRYSGAGIAVVSEVPGSFATVNAQQLFNRNYISPSVIRPHSRSPSKNYPYPTQRSYKGGRSTPSYNYPKTMPDEAVIRSKSIESCVNNVCPIEALTGGAVAKMPVVLAKFTLQINLNSVIELPEPVLSIKDSKKKVEVTECVLLHDTKMLFIKGVVHKSISYVAYIPYDEWDGQEELKQCSVDIPFSCTTPITFNGMEPAAPQNNSAMEFQYSKAPRIQTSPWDEGEKTQRSGEFNQTSTEFYNELPYCELVSSKIVEFDEYLNLYGQDKIETGYEETVFAQIDEKMVLFLTLLLMQNRQVMIPPAAPISTAE